MQEIKSITKKSSLDKLCVHQSFIWSNGVTEIRVGHRKSVRGPQNKARRPWHFYSSWAPKFILSPLGLCCCWCWFMGLVIADVDRLGHGWRHRWLSSGHCVSVSLSVAAEALRLRLASDALTSARRRSVSQVMQCTRLAVAVWTSW